MTKTEGEALLVKWKQHKHPYKCPHAAVDMESTEDGDYTGNYRCRACGAMVDPPPKAYRIP